MKKNNRFLRQAAGMLLALLVMLLSVSVLCEASTDSDTMAAEVSALFKKYKTTGGALVVIHDGEVVWEQYYGYARKTEKTPVSGNTAFRINGVTELVTALRVMQLVEAGFLDLDEDISAYLGYEVVNPNTPDRPITLRTLLTHTSSLNPTKGYTKPKNTLSSLIAKDSGHTANFRKDAPGTRVEYTPFNSGILGAILEHETEKNLNDTMTNGLFSLVGVDAAFNPTLLADPDCYAGVYSKSGASTEKRSSLAGAWDASVDPDTHYRLSSGSLWISAMDLAKIGTLFCEEGDMNGLQILQADTISDMLSRQTGQGVVTAETPYSLGVERMSNLVENRVIWGKEGIDKDTVACLYFDIHSRFVFVMLTNGCNPAKVDGVSALGRRMFEWAWTNFGG